MADRSGSPDWAAGSSSAVAVEPSAAPTTAAVTSSSEKDVKQSELKQAEERVCGFF